MNSFKLEDLANRVRDILVFTGNQSRILLDDGDLRAESSIHLRKLETDVTAADDNQMLRDEIDLHHPGIGEEGCLLDARKRRNKGAPPDVDENFLGGQRLIADAQRLGVLEARGSGND